MESSGDDSIRRARSARFATVPIVLAGAIAMTAGLTGPAAHAEARQGSDLHRRHTTPERSERSGPVFSTAVAHTSNVMATASVTSTRVPDTYTVQQGDTVSSIATRYGISAQEVLVRNGLAWNTIIHPGQSLRLTTTRVVAAASSSDSADENAGDTTGDVSSTGTSAAASTSTTKRSVTVVVGDTIATIAAAHGVTVSALLAVNGLTYTSTIYAGSSLIIPDTSALTNEQRRNAATIVSVGRSLGVPQRGIVVALAAAMQESGLRNLPSGDRDSVGVFQQRPSQGWGPANRLLDVAYAARLFFGGPDNPNAGTTNGLLDVAGWTAMSVTDAAQAVQQSAYPEAYARWEKPAEEWLASL